MNNQLVNPSKLEEQVQTADKVVVGRLLEIGDIAHDVNQRANRLAHQPNMNRTPLPTPTIGRIVHYMLNQTDADEINKLRASQFCIKLEGAPYTGHIADKINLLSARGGNTAAVGQIYPAMIVRVWAENPTPETCCNLQVFLDGNDSYWATSRVASLEPREGAFTWPSR